MRGVRLLTNHCPRIGLSLAVSLGIMLAGSISVQAANAAGDRQLEPAAASSIREKVTQNWNRPSKLPVEKDVRVQVRLRLDRSGGIVGDPKITVTGVPQERRKALAASALRAVLSAAPFKNLPIDQYDDWKEVIINFDASDPAN